MGSKTLMMTASAAALVCASASLAGPVLPGFDFTVSVDGVDQGFVFNQADLGGGLYEFADTSYDGGDWGFGDGYNVTVNQSTYQLSMAFGLVNNTLVDHTYVVYATAPMMAFSGSSMMVATGGATLNDANQDGSAASMNAAGVAGFQTSVDGADAIALLDPMSLSVVTPGGGDTQTDNSGGLIPGPASLSSDMAVAWSFTLSPGDTMSVTSSFRLFPVVPAPSALALLGVAGLAGRRRRRR